VVYIIVLYIAVLEIFPPINDILYLSAISNSYTGIGLLTGHILLPLIVASL
jgi:hypothetical protein